MYAAARERDERGGSVARRGWRSPAAPAARGDGRGGGRLPHGMLASARDLLGEPQFLSVDPACQTLNGCQSAPWTGWKPTQLLSVNPASAKFYTTSRVREVVLRQGPLV
eukprot:364528-Chlamydomonas_euryale.AAC.4